MLMASTAGIPYPSQAKPEISSDQQAQLESKATWEDVLSVRD